MFFFPEALPGHPQSRWLLARLTHLALVTPLAPRPIATAYATEGTGETPVLLLHGFDSSLLEFFCLFPRLAHNHPTWAVDMLGFGFTERPPDLDLSAQTVRCHLHRFWQERIAKPVLLIGASMGGASAIDFALHHPECVRGLVLIASVGFSFGPLFTRYLFPPFDWLAVEIWRQLKHRISFEGVSEREVLLAEAARLLALHTHLPGWHAALIRFAASRGYEFLTPHIGRIRQPTLILWGERDAMLGTEDAEKFHRTIEGSRLVWLPDCGHSPHIEQAERVAALILEFAAVLEKRTD